MEWPEMMWLDNEEVSCCSSIVLDFLGVSYLDPSYYPPETKKISLNIHGFKDDSNTFQNGPKNQGTFVDFRGEYPCTWYFAQLKIWIQAAQPGALLGHHEDWFAWPRWDQDGWGLRDLQKIAAESFVVPKELQQYTDFEEDFFKVFFSSELQTFIFVGILVA